MACKSSINRPKYRKTRRCLDQRDGSQALGDVNAAGNACWRRDCNGPQTNMPKNVGSVKT